MSSISNSLLSTISLILSSLSTKVINIVLNAMILKFISKESYYISKIELDFLFILIQFIPISVMRTAFQKICTNKESEIEQENIFENLLNLNKPLIFLFTFLSIPISYLYILTNEKLQDYKIHIVIYCISSVIEIIIEPILCFMSLKLMFKQRILSFTINNISRIVITFIFSYMGLDVWAFTIGRFSASILYCSYLILNGKINHIYFLDFYKYQEFTKIFWKTNELENNNSDSNDQNFKEDPCKTNNIDKEDKKMNLSKEDFLFYRNTIQNNFLKIILSNFEKFTIKIVPLDEFEKTEIHFIAENFSIIVRYLYQPIEENFYIILNKFNRSINILYIALKMYLIFFLLLNFYFYLCGSEVFNIVFTDKWTNSKIIQRIYCFYVSILSFNGIIEAYGTSIYNSDLNFYVQMIKFIKFGLNVLLSYLSSSNIELKVSQIITLVFNILSNIVLIRISGFSVIDKSILSTKSMVITFFLFSILCLIKENFNLKTIVFILISFFGFLINVLFIYVFEKDSLKQLVQTKESKSDIKVDRNKSNKLEENKQK